MLTENVVTVAAQTTANQLSAAGLIMVSASVGVRIFFAQKDHFDAYVYDQKKSFWSGSSKH
jgi:hypothetical protein